MISLFLQKVREKESMKKHCQHCYPAKPSHFLDKLSSFADDFFIDKFCVLIGKVLPLKLLINIEDGFIQVMLKGLEFFRVINLTEEIDRKQYSNRGLVIWDEAKKRGYNIYSYKKGEKYFNLFVWETSGKKVSFHDNPIYNFSKIKPADILVDNKGYFKEKLKKHNFPYTQGGSFRSKKKAFNYGKKIGFPLIVKPASSSLSRHVTINIQSEEDLIKAIKVAKEMSFYVIVERFLSGDVHRAVVVGDKFVVVARRMPAKVVGNGFKTIEELIEEKNKHPWREDPKRQDSTLHKIEINERLKFFLGEQGFGLESILNEGTEFCFMKKLI